MDDRLQEARRYGSRQEAGDTRWSKLQDHEIYSRIQEPPRAVQSRKRGNITIPLCNSVANAELWSSTSSRYGRYLHSVSLMCLSERDFWKDTCARKCPKCRRQSSKTLQILCDYVRAERSRLAAVIGSETEHWKRPRRDCHGQSHERSKSLRSTSTTNASTESNTKQGTLSELAERPWNFHESANALTNCLQTRDTTRKTDQSMFEAANSMFPKLLKKTNDDLDRALQPQEDHRAQATGNGSRCSRAETSSESLCPPTEAATEIHCSHFETVRSCSETINPSRDPLEYVASGDCHKQLVLSVTTHRM